LTVWYAAEDGQRLSQAFGNYRELATRARSFAAMAVFKLWQPTMTGPAEPERLDGQRVSAGYFRVLGVQPILGRSFDPADDRRGGPDVVVISDALWRRRFAADPSIVGRRITLNDQPYTVLGVMPPSFEDVLQPSAQLWGLLQYDTSLPIDGREWGHHLQMAARVLPDVDIGRAVRELNAIAAHPTPEFARPPWCRMNHGLIAVALQEDLTRAVKPALLAVLGAVLLVLTIACVNVTNLLLARGAQRRGEFAVRAALGAGRSRLVQQLITESVLLAMLGGLVGIVVAQGGVRALVALSPAEMPRLGAIRVDATVFLFALGISAVIGAAVGLAPALQATRGDLRDGLQDGSRRTVGGHRFTRAALVITEVALAVVLSVGAGLLLRSLERLFAISPGFDASHVLTMQVQVASADRYRNDAAFHQFFDRALDAARQVPGVAQAAFVSQLPLSGSGADGAQVLDSYGAHIEPSPTAPIEIADVLRYAVTPSYFAVMHIPLIRGRLLDERDMAPSAVRPIVVSETFAKTRFAGGNPIGRHIRLGGFDTRPWDEIVGVVGDVKQASLATAQANAAYATTDQWLWADNPLWLVVRAHGDAAALAPAIRRAVWSVDKDQPIVRVATMESLLSASEAERRFALIVFEAFALAALALSAIGIYGVLSGNVAERTREIGVRAALGASGGNILGLVVRQGMRLTLLGLVLGLGAAALASRAVVSLLFDISRLDPATYAGVVALLLGVAAIACWAPAWRAARVDPSIALRAE
jgi:putative ABC transport system permease protein